VRHVEKPYNVLMMILNFRLILALLDLFRPLVLRGPLDLSLSLVVPQQ
jgi:hypothetical protein